ncbi:hypothetical protein [Aeromonas sp. R7-1]|uniref:hypothetical protein n=1 Tax=Aeromonas sp. R7-1 TaxID=3138473 RepID=UPI0034A4F796
MKQFQIDPRSNKKNGQEITMFYVDADDHQDAASKAAKKMFGGKVFGKRNSGDANGSGMFQAYYHMGSNPSQSNSCGSLFHVMEV